MNKFSVSHSRQMLEIKGSFFLSGPENFSEDGLQNNTSQLVKQLFEGNSAIDQIAVTSVDSGAVWTRADSPLTKKLQEEDDREPDAEKFLKLLEVAGFKIQNHYYLQNGYDKRRNNDPWLLAFTDMGHITIGNRRSVIAVDWEMMPNVRGSVTTDDVTKDDRSVHAWSNEKLLAYLTELYQIYKKAKLEHPDGVT